MPHPEEAARLTGGRTDRRSGAEAGGVRLATPGYTAAAARFPMHPILPTFMSIAPRAAREPFSGIAPIRPPSQR
jgi:hypothetical protein